ncbi:MAG TPA: cytidine deaminase [Oculatellaceae cyanobacterium]|jgi:cytidine deaminase
MASAPDLQQAKKLLESARLAAKHAYAPYSHFPVGAAILTDKGHIYTGANVENASYGLTICAERVAVFKAISDGVQRFQAVAVWAEKTPNGSVTPCGACRQVLAEFLGSETPVFFHDQANGAIRWLTMDQLLPAAFAPDSAQGDSSPHRDNNSLPD